MAVIVQQQSLVGDNHWPNFISSNQTSQVMPKQAQIWSPSTGDIASWHPCHQFIGCTCQLISNLQPSACVNCITVNNLKDYILKEPERETCSLLLSIIMFQSRRYRRKPVLTNAISVARYWWLWWIFHSFTTLLLNENLPAIQFKTFLYYLHRMTT